MVADGVRERISLSFSPAGSRSYGIGEVVRAVRCASAVAREIVLALGDLRLDGSRLGLKCRPTVSNRDSVRLGGGDGGLEGRS
jgi:hypothetical protein